jgi:hypothetical protein
VAPLAAGGTAVKGAPDNFQPILGADIHGRSLYR